jgi:UDPglucose 6-dehydrogenase
MKVGMIGLGKLGLPCLLAMEKYGGHTILGYEISEQARQNIVNREVHYWEQGVNDLLIESNIKLVDSIQELVENCEIIFIAVQTPHDAEFEGRTPLPDKRQDFDYSYLVSVINELAISMKNLPNKSPLITVISTVLPGTMRENVIPLLKKANQSYRFAYNPYFIAMGTTVFDFMNPEFVLIGADAAEDADFLADFYDFLDSKKMKMTIESAELTKVAYNTFIGFKIVFANTLSEIVSKKGGNVDEVTNALGQANYRLMSSTYLSAGMGDGGGCHPRDQIAMSWLAKNASLSTDLFDYLASARDRQTERQAELIIHNSVKMNLPIILLGISYKPNSPLEIGSPARLLEYYLTEKGYIPEIVDPWVLKNAITPGKKGVYFVSSRHDEFSDLSQIKNSLVIDPWGHVVKVGEGTTLLQPGRENPGINSQDHGFNK